MLSRANDRDEVADRVGIGHTTIVTIESGSINEQAGNIVSIMSEIAHHIE